MGQNKQSESQKLSLNEKTDAYWDNPIPHNYNHVIWGGGKCLGREGLILFSTSLLVKSKVGISSCVACDGWSLYSLHALSFILCSNVLDFLLLSYLECFLNLRTSQWLLILLILASQVSSVSVFFTYSNSYFLDFGYLLWCVLCIGVVAFKTKQPCLRPRIGWLGSNLELKLMFIRNFSLTC